VTPAISFQHVDIVFGDKQKAALDLIDAGRSREEVLAATGAVVGVADACLDIAPAEICVLMGLSGSGKSTLLRAVNGLNAVARGRVKIAHDGDVVDVTTCAPETLRSLRMHRIAMVFQQFALLPWRTVAENVGFGLELRGLKGAALKRVVDEKLDLVGLSKWAGKYAHELSGGMQQRVGLARAFATDADILLMDEPFSALDPLIRDKLQDELIGLQTSLKKTIVFVSHDLDEAFKIGNRIAIMESARIVQCGTAEDIALTPKTPYVAEFVRHMNPLNVLRGRSLMTPADALKREGGAVICDAEGHVRIEVDDNGRPTRVTLDGREARLHDVVRDETPVGAADIVLAPVDLKLRTAIELRRASGHPVILVDQLGRLAGLCGDEEIYRALLKDHARRT
jgi:glycine betaine/proline transport system ATP-binding protein